MPPAKPTTSVTSDARFGTIVAGPPAVGGPAPRPDGGKTMRLPCSRRAAWLAAALLSLLPAAPAPAADPPYDLLVRNGRIIDGTGNPWFFGDVAVHGDRVVAVGRVPPGPARREIDA